MPSSLKLTNNAISTLAANITTTQTSITLATGGGAKFPSLSAGQYFPATIIKSDGTLEIVKVTARSTDTLTVVRGQELTSGTAFSAGDRVELRMTAGSYDIFMDKTSSTGAAKLPSGTSAERPVGEAGHVRINLDLATPEWYDASSSSWKPFSSGIPVDLLVIGGGAGGGYNSGGGAGAGGHIETAFVLTKGVTYAVTIGAGGVGGTANDIPGTNGSRSRFGPIYSDGGGGGRSYSGTGIAGASGGGGTGNNAGGAGISGQGNTGGTGYSDDTSYALGGAGAGADAVGGSAVAGSRGGNGGAGKTSSITGVSVTRAGGGAGGGATSVGIPGGTGGTGGGGKGGDSTAVGNGSANTGSGGGGGNAAGQPNSVGGNGGSGAVIMRILTALYSGVVTGSPTVTTDGAYTVVEWASAGEYTA